MARAGLSLMSELNGKEIVPIAPLVPTHEFVEVIRSPYKNAPKSVESRAMDPSITRLEPVIAAMDDWIDELYLRVKDGDTPKFREKCFALAQKEDWGALTELLEKGVDRDIARKFLIDTLERRSVRAEKATEIGMRSDNVVTKRELNKTLGDVFDVLAEKIVDQKLLHEVIAGISQRIAGARPDGESR